MLLTNVPAEILHLVAYFLDAADIRTLSLTDKRLRSLLLPEIWHYLFININYTEELLSKGVIFRDFLHHFGFLNIQKPCPDLCKFICGPHKCIKNYINIDSGRLLPFFEAVNTNQLSQQLQLVKVLVINLPILRTFEQEGLLEHIREGIFSNVQHFGLLKNGTYQLENLLDVFRIAKSSGVILQSLNDSSAFCANLETFDNLKVLRMMFDDQMEDEALARINFPPQLEFLEVNDSYSLQQCKRDIGPLLRGHQTLKGLELNLWVCDVLESCENIPDCVQSLTCYFGKNTGVDNKPSQRFSKPNITRLAVGDYGCRIFKSLHFPNLRQLEISKSLDFDRSCVDYIPRSIDYGTKLRQILFLNVATEHLIGTGLLNSAVSVESIELYFATMQITVNEDFASMLFSALSQLSRLKTLVLHFELGRFDDFAPFLATLVYECKALKRLYYKGTGVTEFLESIADPPTIYINDGVTYRSMGKPTFRLNMDKLVKRGRHLS